GGRCSRDGGAAMKDAHDEPRHTSDAEATTPTEPVNHGDAAGTGLSGVSIRRPIFTLMLMLGLIVLGLFSFNRLPIDQFPDVEIPVVAVQTIYPGASPETIEREVTRPIGRKSVV